MNKEIIINHNIFETRVAVLEDGVISEFFLEQEQNQNIVGNIYKGKVLRILPGINSAFLDIGVERASFLHVGDLSGHGSNDLSHSDEPQADQPWEEAESTGSNHDPAATVIQNSVKEGDELLVQVAKGAISSKGPRVTANISLPGCYLVFMPYSQNVGVSRQIHDDGERKRLREIVHRLKPKHCGFIIRTVAQNIHETDIQADINYLLSQWDEIRWNFQQESAPALIYKDLSISQRIIRDMLPSTISRIMIDHPSEYEEIRTFLKQFLPRHQKSLRRYRGKQPLFETLGIEGALHSVMDHKVWLPSGGYLVIEQAEALTAIDVNTGSFVGKESQQETVLATNLEATTEIVRQLKLRNIGGIIIIDFIDMLANEDRDQVYQALKEALRHDRARSKILQISEIGLVEMTRKRDRESLEQLISDICPYCQGTGKIKSLRTVTMEMLREINRLYPNSDRNQQTLTITAHPDLIDHLFNEGNSQLALLQRQFPTLAWQAANYFHHEQFEIVEF